MGGVIKQLRVPAKCQETVLGVFEESGWPRCIDDPLPPCNGEDTRYRLHNTIKSLNGHHLLRRIRFTFERRRHGGLLGAARAVPAAAAPSRWPPWASY